MNCVNTRLGSEGWDEGLNRLEVEGQAENDIDEYVEDTDEEDMVMYV